MASWEMKIITAEARRLLATASEDAGLRADLRALAQEILAATEAPQPCAATEPEPLPSGSGPASPAEERAPDGPTTSEASQAVRPEVAEPLRELTLGRSRPASAEVPHSTDRTAGPAVTDADLPRIKARCRVKAEAARWAAERQRRRREDSASQDGETPADREIAEWADRWTDCFHWLDAPDASPPADLALLDQVGGCFEAVAEALTAVAGVRDQRGALERALPLLAEAQSALRRALLRLHAPDDPDQLAVYELVRATASRRRIYLGRYMRADDLADPAGWPDLVARIEALTGSGPHPRPQGPQIERVLEHQKRIQEGCATDQDWRAVIEAVEAMVGAGVPPSNREIRDLLLPVIDDLPDEGDRPPGFRLVLREIDRFLATRPQSSKATAAHVPTAEVKEAARLLGGRSVVLIGGSRRPESQKLLRTALGLKELIWIETKEHQAIGAFEPVVARPDVALVLLAIRWSSHAFGDVKQFCERHGKPLVRLPGGYGPNQVAVQILAQGSEHLSTAILKGDDGNL